MNQISIHTAQVSSSNSKSLMGVWVEQRPVAVEAEPVHGTAGAECQRVTRLVDNTGEGIGAGNPGQTVLRTMASVDQVGEVALQES